MTAHREDKLNACHYGATGTYKATYDHQHLNIGYYNSSEQSQIDIKPLLLLEEYEQLCKEFGLCDDSQPLTHPQSHPLSDGSLTALEEYEQLRREFGLCDGSQSLAYPRFRSTSNEKIAPNLPRIRNARIKSERGPKHPGQSLKDAILADLAERDA